MAYPMMTTVEIRHFHLFCGLGGGAAGFNRGRAQLGKLQAKFRCLGGIDVDPASIRDFGKLAGVPGTVLDLFDRDQYIAFHGHEPPAGWKAATIADIHRAAGYERPHIVFLSAPCKGFSGLLSEGKSKSDKYQALNRLTVRGIWLMLEAWKDDLPELLVFENVPRIASRGRHLLDQIKGLLQAYGYAIAESTHDCGELGELGQSRKRFLMVGRLIEKVSPFLYEPHKHRLRAIGDILGKMPLPGDVLSGPMHRIPNLQWKTWVRLAFVEAGSDWRSLNKLAVTDGVLRDYCIMPETAWQNSVLGVIGWNEASGTVTGRSSPTTGRFSVADPRQSMPDYQQYGIVPWNATMGTVSGQSKPGGGKYSVADPRRQGTGTTFGKYAVVPFDQSTGTVISGSTTGQGAYAVADPRSGMDVNRSHYQTGGHYGVISYETTSYAVTAHAKHDQGHWSVADPRLPEPAENCVSVIRALDGTWHRPFTTLELAALQGLVDPEEQLELDGLSDAAWRERIGNAVPPPAAQAIAGVMGHTLLLAMSGETFALGNTPIWVQPIATALMAAQGGEI